MLVHLIDTKGNIIFSADNCYSGPSEGMIPIMMNKKWGFINLNGKIVIPCQYDRVSFFKNGIAPVRIDEKWGIINRTGKLICPCIYSKIQDVPDIHCGILRIIDNVSEKCYYIDIDGNKVFNTEGYYISSDFDDGFASLTKENEDGSLTSCLINDKGETIIPFGKYLTIGYLGFGVVYIDSSNGEGLIKTTGKEIVPIGKYDGIESLFDFDTNDKNNWILNKVISWVCKNGKAGYIDRRTGLEIVPLEYDREQSFEGHHSEHMMIIKPKGITKTYIYDEENYSINIIECNDIGYFKEGLCSIVHNNKLSYINRDGKIVIPYIDDCTYVSDANEFKDGLCIVGNKIIDKNGNTILTIPTGNKAKYLGKQVFKFYQENHPFGFKMVNISGKTLCEGFDIEEFGDFPRAVKKENKTGNEKWVFIDEKGEIAFPCEFNKPYSFHNGYAKIEEPIIKSNVNKGCYIATSIYGSYDSPEVWTLRRYRDNVLDIRWDGRLFIKLYYMISPTLVKWFGNAKWFKTLFLRLLNKMVSSLNRNGFEDTPYKDKY